MRIISVDNLITQAKETFEKELTHFKDQPFIHCKFTFYFSLYYTIEDYLINLIKAEDYQAYKDHAYKYGYLKYWRGKAIFEFQNKREPLTGDLHDIMEKLGLNKLAKIIEREIRERTGTLINYDANHIDFLNGMDYNNTHQNP
jgi:hypothetical protein